MPEEIDWTGQEIAAAAHALCEEGARLHDEAEYDAARARYERALAMLEGEEGSDPAQMARCLDGLGRVLMKLGDDAGAGEALERALAIQNQVFDARHPDRAATLHDLGELHANQGDREAGMALLREALSIRAQVLGPGASDTLESTIVVALLLAHAGDHDTAREMLTNARDLCRRTLGEQHRTTARVLNALGRLWARDKATYDRAQAAYERALAIYETLLGPDHPWVALVLNNLAALLSDRQQDAAARPLVERSLAIHERVYGPDNWRTSYVLVNLADILSRQGDPASARRLLERALVNRERAWGPEHPETVHVLRKLVSALGTLQQAGDESAMLEGIALFPCLTALEAAGGKRDLIDKGLPGSHLDPAQAAARLHDLAGKLAEELARRPLTAADRATLETAGELARQADERYAAGDYAAAVARLEEALRLQEKVLGEYHLEHVVLLKKLAQAQPHVGHYSAVLPIYQRIAEIHHQVLGPVHPMTTQALGQLWQRLDYEYGPAAALPLQEQMLASMEASLGASDPLVAMARQTSERWRAMVSGAQAGPGEAAEGGRPAGPSLSERREAALAAATATPESLLAGLEAVDWHSLRHCYGPADDVPNLLRLLLADDEQVRQDAWQELTNNLWHQGSIYQATSYAVPFLLRMLQAEDTPEKADILAFLQGIAEGVPYLTERHTWMEEVLAKQGRDFQAEIELADGYTQHAHEAVAEGLDTYLELLDDLDPDTREWAFAVLCILPEYADRTVPILLDGLEGEPEPGLQARLVEHLGWNLGGLLPAGRQGPVTDILEELVRFGETPTVRFAAAVALANTQGDETPSAAVDVLEEAMADPASLERDESATGDRLIVEKACSALAHVDAVRRIPALMRCLGRVREPEHAHRVALLLLDSALLGLARTLRYTGTPKATEEAITFGVTGPKVAGLVQERTYPRVEAPLDVGSLTPSQRRALQAVLDSPAVWALPGNPLEVYGLPASPAAVRELLPEK
jgi:tetratricopeptide (TPR) repeat protein